MKQNHLLTLACALALATIQITSPAVCAGERSPVDSKKTIAPPDPADPWQVMLAMPGWQAAT